MPSIMEGNLFIPPVTIMVLARFGDDERVLDEFSAGTHRLEVTVGPLSTKYEGYALRAEPFLNHAMAPIRKWAQREVESARQCAKHFRKKEEDEDFEP
jgi:hypothetical protein